MVTVSGENIFITKKFITATYEDDIFRKILAEMKVANREKILEMIDVRKRYDLDLLEDLMASFEKVKGRAELKKLSEYTVDNKIKFFGFVLRFLTIEGLIKKGPPLWKKVYSEGFIYIKEMDDNKSIFRVKDFKFQNSLAFGFMYWVEVLLRKVSRKEVISSFKRITPTETEFEFTIIGS